jgi:Protein of unknown function (DUF3631)
MAPRAGGRFRAMSAAPVEITEFSKDNGPLTKRIHRTPDGSISNDSSQCRMSSGFACRAPFALNPVRELATLITDMPPNGAIALGALRDGLPELVKVVAKQSLDKNPGAVARSAENIVYAARPGFVLLDHDTKGMPDAVAERLLAIGGFAKAVESVCPALAAAGSVIRRSTSCGIYDLKTGQRFAGSNGVHLYLLVKDASDARRFLYTLHDRLWLAGLGWILPGRAGQELNRSIIDKSIFGAERLVFEAGPELDPGLAQEPREPVIHDGDALDTRKACKDLSKADEKELKRFFAAERRRTKPECHKAQQTFVDVKISEAIARGTDPKVARRTAESWTRSELLPDAVLHFDDLGEVTVASILADPQRFEGETLADPIEGVSYGRNCAIVKLRDDGKPWIFSFAHGGAKYDLKNGDSTESTTQETDIDKEIARLSKLGMVEYERLRDEAAATLGVRAQILDKLVKSEKSKGDRGQGSELVLNEPTPWHEPVNGAALLDEIEEIISKFVVCLKEVSIAVALWMTATWFSAGLEVAPILNVKSPEMRCGKSTLLALVGKLAYRQILVSNISPAALFRSIEKFSPTLILDEADTFLTDNEEARGVINSGHTRQTAFVIRTVGDEHEPRRFSTFGFKVIAGIGKRAATIEDRSIQISLKRKLSSERVARLRHADPSIFETLTRKLARFSQDNKDRIAAARPVMPDGLNDRQQDCWEPLYAIAQTAGEAWGKKAEKAALRICGASVEAEASFFAQLLSDIRDIFAGREELSSEILTKGLLALSDRPWGECNRGKPLTQNKLARWLKEFEIRPKDIGPKTDRVKGYECKAFADAFKRYIPESSESATAHPRTGNEINDLDENQTAHQGKRCAVANPANPLNRKVVRGCAVGDPQEEGENDKCADGTGWETLI